MARQGVTLDTPVEQPPEQLKRLQLPVAQIPQQGVGTLNPAARLLYSAPQDVVGGAVMAVVMAALEPKCGTGKRGPDRPGTVRPPRKCKHCRELGYSEEVQLGCSGRGGMKYCPQWKETVAGGGQNI